MCGNVFASDKYNTTSNINGVTVNWEYELNDAGQIINLKCTNPGELTGSIAIPGTLEEKTVVSIGSEAFSSATGITEVILPDSVTEIEYGAFRNCTNLNKVDLGSITNMSFQIFSGCTSLTEITIPKTLKKGSVSPVLDNSNITKITLEEGLTIVPENLCSNTGITEIVIPDSVTEIEYGAFNNCDSLEKITILDNVTKMGIYNISNVDSVFENHNENLTIYCYKDSMAANYAKKYNIKYEYLTRPATGEGDKDDTNNGASGNTDGNKELPVRLPQAGVNTIIAISFVGIVVVAVIMYKKYKAYKDIK